MIGLVLTPQVTPYTYYQMATYLEQVEQKITVVISFLVAKVVLWNFLIGMEISFGPFYIAQMNTDNITTYFLCPMAMY